MIFGGHYSTQYIHPSESLQGINEIMFPKHLVLCMAGHTVGHTIIHTDKQKKSFKTYIKLLTGVISG